MYLKKFTIFSQFETKWSKIRV